MCLFSCCLRRKDMGRRREGILEQWLWINESTFFLYVYWGGGGVALALCTSITNHNFANCNTAFQSQTLTRPF